MHTQHKLEYTNRNNKMQIKISRTAKLIIHWNNNIVTKL